MSGNWTPVHSASGDVTWTPWTDGFAVGFEVTDSATGQTRRVYLNPSTEGDEDPTGNEACVFLYEGPPEDPQALSWLNVLAPGGSHRVTGTTPSPDAQVPAEGITPGPAREALLSQLAASYGPGNGVQAVLDLARVAQVAVAWEDRQSIEGYLGHEFTDTEWAELAPRLEDLDEWVGQSGGRESITSWMSQIVIDAGIDLTRLAVTEHDARPDDDPTPGDRCKDCGARITWTGPSQYDWSHI